ncbi:sulfotransferase [Thermococcus sp. GR7]|uniref:sulfotransferase n=1 Tax=unclassified Thermococcus TaxID=2627626 RepID=UPI00143100E2|nr:MULTISPECIES: sulfotransferase [unclassified Thermococcus]NJE46079.1 sulfotransferase [Thermococcus sp. GR7]NJE78285.1 sulfotransferase [Thermococcus sp. GR4]NJF22276.1 sulfotransferase [Thermococcus sp. GR5]
MGVAEKLLARFNHSVDELASFLHDYRTEDTIAIFGSPRSGSTWLMELLESIPGYKSVFEPFHPRWYPEFGRDGFPYTPYVPDDAELAWLNDYLKRVFSGRVHAMFPYRRPMLSRLRASRLVVKFVRANTVLPWVAGNFRLRGLYFIIRHPCATIASQLATGFFSKITIEQLLNEVNKVPELAENWELVTRLRGINSEIERLAAIWAFENYIPLASKKPYPWYTVIYERLVVNPEGELKGIFGYIEEEVPEGAVKRIKTPSKVTRKTYGRDYIGTPRQLIKWREKLSERQVEDILKVVSWFGMDFYTEEPEPDYDALLNWRPPF